MISGLSVAICIGIGLLFLSMELVIVSGSLGVLGLCFLFYACWATTKLYGLVSGAVLFFTLTTVVFLLFAWLVTRVSMKKKLVSSAVINDTSAPPLNGIVGKSGRTLTPLVPSGKIEIEDRIYDAFSPQGFLPQGTSVDVVSVDNVQAVVRSTDGRSSKT